MTTIHIPFRKLWVILCYMGPSEGVFLYIGIRKSILKISICMHIALTAVYFPLSLKYDFWACGLYVIQKIMRHYSYKVNFVCLYLIQPTGVWGEGLSRLIWSIKVMHHQNSAISIPFVVRRRTLSYIIKDSNWRPFRLS